MNSDFIRERLERLERRDGGADPLLTANEKRQTVQVGIEQIVEEIDLDDEELDPDITEQLPPRQP
ncbi:MAG: hypothetical protein H6707_13295 [Deltaproteobacteria bacterium]|nr:hypothetical protein [Deltaproteobacteria bacterium]